MFIIHFTEQALLEMELQPKYSFPGSRSLTYPWRGLPSFTHNMDNKLNSMTNEPISRQYKTKYMKAS